MKIPVSNLGPELQNRLQSRDVIVFDGECVLCSAFFRFIVRHDRDERFFFAMAQGDVGQACFKALGLPLEDFQTNLVIKDGWIYTDLDGFAAAMAGLGWPWKGLSAVGWFPAVLKVPLYRLVARNRYRIFGRYESCMIPEEGVRSRFLH